MVMVRVGGHVNCTCNYVGFQVILPLILCAKHIHKLYVFLQLVSNERVCVHKHVHVLVVSRLAGRAENKKRTRKKKQTKNSSIKK